MSEKDIDIYDDFESPLRFPNPSDEKYWSSAEYGDGSGITIDHFASGLFQEDYESCLIELGLIIEKVYDPTLRKKLESLMRGVEDWLK